MPVWSNTPMEFKTAKMKTYSPTAKRIVSDVYKEASILIEEADAESVKITVDIPDKFFMKEGSLHSFSYKMDMDKNQEISYTISSGDKLASVTFFFDYTENIPNKIVVAWIDDITKIKSNPVYTLYEFK
jgi:hypothetical protein